MKKTNQKTLWIILGVLVVVFLFVVNWLTLRDWFVLATYDPPPEIVRLADNSYMSEQGRDYFYASRPELNNAEDFNNNCQIPEAGIVLGCYSDWTIYIFKMLDPKLEGIEETTSAHEMLHAAYLRLSIRERNNIDDLLLIQLENTNDQAIKDNIKFYQETSPEHLNTEMYAIFGTEVQLLVPELEQHYSQFFTDREALVAISEKYSAAYEQMVSQSDACSENLSSMVKELDQESDQLNEQLSRIEQEKSEIQELDPKNDQAEIEEKTKQLEQDINDYNQQVLDYQIKVGDYNETAQKCSSLATAQLDIFFNLNSTLQEAQTQ